MNTRLIFIFYCVIAMGLFSCKDKDYPQPAIPTTALFAINSSPDTLNYFINGTRQNNVAPLYSGGSNGYVQTITGTQNYEVKKSGSAVVLFSTPFTLNTSTYYSLFMGGETAAKTFMIVDDLNAAAAAMVVDTSKTSVAIRFVQASPDAGNLDVIEAKGDTINFKGCAFKYVSPFVRVRAGSAREFKIYASDNAKVQVDTTLVLTAGNIYTLFTKGKIGGTGTNALGVDLIINGQ